jgi:hypothetical protein
MSIAGTASWDKEYASDRRATLRVNISCAAPADLATMSGAMVGRRTQL